jgi:hypothetical protein
MAKSKFSDTDPERAAETVRRAQAVQMRLAGHTFDEIATELHYHDRGTAYRAVKLALSQVGREDARELRDLDLMRLDRMLAIIWPQIEDGDLAAVDRALRILKRRAEILGYDQQNVVHINASQTTVSVDNTSGRVETLREVLQQVDGNSVFEIARLLHATLPTNVNNGEGLEPATITPPPDE